MNMRISILPPGVCSSPCLAEIALYMFRTFHIFCADLLMNVPFIRKLQHGEVICPASE